MANLDQFEWYASRFVGTGELHTHYPKVAQLNTRTLIVNGNLDESVTLGQPHLFLKLPQNSLGFVRAHRVGR